MRRITVVVMATRAGRCHAGRRDNAQAVLDASELFLGIAYRVGRGGADYSTQRVNFAVDEQRSPAYLAINPKGRVPTLVTDRRNLVETPAILAFIAQSYPQADLAPLTDPFGFAQVQSFNSYLCSTLHVAHAHLEACAKRRSPVGR